MRLELHQSLSIKERLENLIDVLIETIIAVGDFLVYKHITVAECFLFVFSVFRAVWFVFVGVENANYSYYFGDAVWQTVFVTMTLMHIAGFFLKNFSLRISACYMYAVVWGTLTVLAAISLTRAPAVPGLLPLSIFSIVMVLRLTREQKEKENV